MSCTCSNCCGSTGDGTCGTNTIIVTNCCGLPEPADGWDGAVDFTAEISSLDLTTGGELTLHTMGAIGTPTVSVNQRIYIFSYQIFVGAPGDFLLFENITGASTLPGNYAKIAAGNLAQHGGMVHRVANRFSRLGNVLHAKHSVPGQVDVIITGKIVTEA